VNAGISDYVVVSPRMAVELMLKNKASGLILVHNHPSGCQQASTPDLEMTKHMREVVEAVGLRFLDHIIISGDSFISIG